MCRLNRSTVRFVAANPFFMFSVNNSFSMKKMEKKFMTVTAFYFWFYMCVQVFITIERIIFFLANGPLKFSVNLFLKVSNACGMKSLLKQCHQMKKKTFNLKIPQTSVSIIFHKNKFVGTEISEQKFNSPK